MLQGEEAAGASRVYDQCGLDCAARGGNEKKQVVEFRQGGGPDADGEGCSWIEEAA